MYLRYDLILSWLFFSFITALPNGDQYVTYDGYQVLRFRPQNEEDRQFIKSRLADVCEVLKFAALDSRPVDYLCPPHNLVEVNETLSRRGLEVEVLHHDFGEHIREHESPRTRIKRQTTTTMNWEEFQRYDTIIKWMEDLAAANPDFTELVDMGRSVEGRKMYMMKVGRSPLGDKTRAVWVDGGIHAREWIAISTSTYILSQVIENFKNVQSDCAEGVVQSVDWYIAPLLNPDGYEYTHTNERLWRKNRQSPPSGSNCWGVDLNRNWDVVGYGLGASSNACSDIYRGTSGNSEPETQAAAATILKYSNNIRVLITIHSYGEYWLTTWGYKTELPVDYEKQANLARRGVNAIKCTNPNRNYNLGSAAVVFYIAGGATDDWGKAVARIPYSFTLELSTAFVVSTSEILPVGNEIWASMKEMAMEAARHPLGPDPAPVPT